MSPRIRTRSRWQLVVALASTLLLCALVAEVGARLLLADTLALKEDERNLTFRFDSRLGWFPVENSAKTFTGSRTISVAHNSRGFRDVEHTPDQRPGLLVLGDSFVWGYDVERPERFTERLAERLEGWAVFNLGVSGYGTDQEFLLLQREFDVHHPDIVLLVVSDNDDADSSTNVRYGGYHKPYYVVGDGGLELRGVPVPRSRHHALATHDTLARSYLVRGLARVWFRLVNPPAVTNPSPTQPLLVALRDFTAGRGAQLVVGLVNPKAELTAFLEREGIPHLPLDTPLVYPSHGRHWTPEGHAEVSARLHGFLESEGLLKR